MKHLLSTGEVLHFTEHTAYRKGSLTKGKNKMQGMCSLNTSSLTNPFCQKMSQHKDLICHNCYARKLESFRAKAMGGCFNRNSQILNKPLKDLDLPHVSAPRLRFDAFGELSGKTNYFNYVRIAEANPQTTFALWTKRIDIIRKHKATLPNLIHIYSSPKLNTLPIEIEKAFNKMFDKIFTVYSISGIREYKVNINCEKFCITCLKCYTHNDIKYINEKLK
jgi:hypothetical protein